MHEEKPTKYAEAELSAKKGESEARTKMLSSYFIAILISYANSTFFTRQTSISSSTLPFLVVEKI